MKLLLYYTLVSLGLDAVAVWVCLQIEKVVPWISMPIFLTLYFAILWVSWVICVRMTRGDEIAPRSDAPSDQRA